MLELAPGNPPLFEGRWQIVATIDDTGATYVYLAWDNVDQAWRMLRMMPFKYAFDKLARGRFSREVDMMGRLQHPHIMSAIHADVDHALHPYAITEVAEAGSLQDWVDTNGAMPPFLVIDVMAQICGALARAHRNGISHGNLRLTEVMVDRRGACKLTGFRGGGEMAEKLVDVRGCGLVLYTLLTGEVWDEKLAPKHLAKLPPSMAGAVEQATQKGRGGYADVSALSRDLEAAVLDLPMPDGGVQPLADPECELPPDPFALFDPEADFHDLVHFARRSADPTYAPSMKELSRAVVKKKKVPKAHEGLSEAAAAFIIPGAELEEVTYQVPGDPNKGDKEWESWKPEEEEKDDEDPFAEPEEPPIISPEMLKQLVAMGLAATFIGLLGASGYGIKLVADDRAVAEQAAAELVAVIRTEGAVVYALSNAGADRAILEERYFAFNDAHNDHTRKIEAARFARTVEQQALAHGLDPVSAGGVVDEATQRVDRIQKSYNVYASRRAQWDRTASSFPAVIPATLGLTSGPAD